MSTSSSAPFLLIDDMPMVGRAKESRVDLLIDILLRQQEPQTNKSSIESITSTSSSSTKINEGSLPHFNEMTRRPMLLLVPSFPGRAPDHSEPRSCPLSSFGPSAPLCAVYAFDTTLHIELPGGEGHASPSRARLPALRIDEFRPLRSPWTHAINTKEIGLCKPRVNDAR
ncbi:hypothetical protein SNOG_01715 [Parastagonospora nodorum SN15]|uniref:Uncharacterized protein n=1 Tax=Phaeosphaeria nodorum (strain SN15 / ATCC MYA-4574 / FGSC 10173) TaxID=321614 RepID=Q0V2P9_PHANO|nr:hypothetical protein SNOG_01715 [Parastagonospora nodorum SN15]EAT91364.1 hypothetical protein SNOG_01715 [Parastagonospora nodorum SN15]